MNSSNSTKLSAVIVTYYPIVKETINNILQFIEWVDTLIIWENTPLHERQKYKISIDSYSDKIIYMGTSVNEGMAYALNKSVEWSIKNNFTHILTMDQDSYWINFGEYREKIIENFRNDSIGIIGPHIIAEHRKSAYLMEEACVVDSVITSGSIFRLDIFSKIGFFREDYFIDAVDLEFCYWAKRNGFKTVILRDCYLKQEYGNTNVKYFLFRKVLTSNYSSDRLFLIVRNHLLLWREYKELSKAQKKTILKEYTTYRVAKILLYESNKLKKIYSIIKGSYFGLFVPLKKRSKNFIGMCKL
jgi:rhamnosyltransferase